MDIEEKTKKQDRFFLYILPAFFIGLSAYVFIMLEFDSLSLIMVIPFLLMAISFHFKHKANISFRKIQSNGEGDYEKCIALAQSKGWEILATEKKQKIVAHTSGTWRSWGELVIINFYDNCLLVNSRPSPFKKASIVTWGKNRINFRAIEAAVKSG